MNEFDLERIQFAKQHKTAEKQVLPYFRRALAKHIEPLVNYVKNNGLYALPLNSIPTLLDNSVWQKVYSEVYPLIGNKFAKREYYNQKRLDGIEQKGAIDLLLNVWSQTFRDYALQYVYQIQQELNDTTVKLIQEALGQDYEIGLDSDGRVRLFFKKLREQNYLRSLVISRTESTTMANLGKEIGARTWINENGGVGYHAWLGRNDARERQTHRETNNTILPLDTPYTVGGELAQRPGDVHLSAAERINCRCSQTIMSEIRYNALVKRGRIVDGKLLGASGSAY